jgi:hypothetical protein
LIYQLHRTTRYLLMGKIFAWAGSRVAAAGGSDMNARTVLQVFVLLFPSVFTFLPVRAWAQPYGYPPYPPPPGYERRSAVPSPSYSGQREQPSAEQGSVKISSPKNGAQIPRNQSVDLVYSVDPGPAGDHVHVYVDGEEVAMLRQLEGRYRVGPLQPGRHRLAIKVVNRGHVPIGIESSVMVYVR